MIWAKLDDPRLGVVGLPPLSRPARWRRKHQSARRCRVSHSIPCFFEILRRPRRPRWLASSRRARLAGTRLAAAGVVEAWLGILGLLLPGLGGLLGEPLAVLGGPGGLTLYDLFAGGCLDETADQVDDQA